MADDDTTDLRGRLIIAAERPEALWSRCNIAQVVLRDNPSAFACAVIE
jgi:hypothetical protein